ncbi:MAG: hypothetical protein ACM339_05030, partial [Ignavibacteria bacterium]
KKSQNQSNKAEEPTAMKTVKLSWYIPAYLILLTFHQNNQKGIAGDKNNLKKRIRTFQLLKPFARKIN